MKQKINLKNKTLIFALCLSLFLCFIIYKLRFFETFYQWSGNTEELHQQYSSIFNISGRNAASHQG